MGYLGFFVATITSAESLFTWKMLSTATIFPWHAKGDTASAGAQIDMLIDRADRVMNLCEMKFTQGDFVITKDYDERLRNKLQTLLTATGKRNVQDSLVTAFGLKMNMYSSRVQRVVTLDDLFRD